MRTQKEIRAIFKRCGYKLKLGKNKSTIVAESYTSTIDGEVIERHPFWSTSDYDWEFLNELIDGKQLKGL